MCGSDCLIVQYLCQKCFLETMDDFENQYGWESPVIYHLGEIWTYGVHDQQPKQLKPINEIYYYLRNITTKLNL